MFFELFLLVAIFAVTFLLNRRYRRDYIPDFSGRYVFITGCDSGFGYQLAVDLDARGLNVYAGCFTTAGADKLKAQCSKRLKTIQIDVTDQSSVDSAKQFILDDLPQGKFLWGLVNNAGILGNVSFELSTMEDYRELMEVNFFGCIRVAQAFAPLLKRSRGRIVQVASMYGRGCFNIAPYTASKHAIEPYTDELRRYMSTYGVRVVTIEPGVMKDTALFIDERWTGYLQRRFDVLPPAKKAELGPNFIEREKKLVLSQFELIPFSGNNRVTMVVDAMRHALGAKHPKTRYAVGNDVRFYIFCINVAPDWLIDAYLQLAKWRM